MPGTEDETKYCMVCNLWGDSRIFGGYDRKGQIMKLLKLTILAILTISALILWEIYELAAQMDFCGLED